MTDAKPAATHNQVSTILKFALGLSLLLAGCNTQPAAERTGSASTMAAIPLTGRVTDAANIIPPGAEDAITARLAALERSTKHQMVVATTPSLGGEDISTFTTRLANAWGVGRKDHNDGVVLMIAPNERKVRIAVGYGLEKSLPDDVCLEIIQNDILPHFKAGDLPAGAKAGVASLARHLMAAPSP
ncbi:methanol dehydrogenase [Novosphingobium barchaimii LL02]|uniref:Methanol dehydrogenase n=1 Tax=Novosphingobium barchaimii LL02 TaxID=1114963 RepID=A0A0J7XLJ5_9SPHN|nr:methanol dehydrogenase [Novosphingobium barchaimii LL02]